MTNSEYVAPKLRGLHSILDSGLQNLKDSVFSASTAAPAQDLCTTLQNFGASSQNEHHSELRSTSSSSSSRRRNSNLRKLLNEIKSGELATPKVVHAGKPPVNRPYQRPIAELSQDTDLAELQKRIAGLENKINMDQLNFSGLSSHRLRPPES